MTKRSCPTASCFLVAAVVAGCTGPASAPDRTPGWLELRCGVAVDIGDEVAFGKGTLGDHAVAINGGTNNFQSGNVGHAFPYPK